MEYYRTVKMNELQWLKKGWILFEWSCRILYSAYHFYNIQIPNETIFYHVFDNPIFVLTGNETHGWGKWFPWGDGDEIGQGMCIRQRRRGLGYVLVLKSSHGFRRISFVMLYNLHMFLIFFWFLQISYNLYLRKRIHS